MPDKMNCRDAFKRLDDFLDRELESGELAQVERHIEACEKCAGEVNFEESLYRSIRKKLNEIDVPPDLRARVSASIRRIEAAGAPEDS